MDRIAAFVGILGLCAAAGALAVGELVVLPGLTDPHPLLDPNLAVSVAGPLHVRCAEITLAGSVVAAAGLLRGASRFAGPAALVAVGLAAFVRLSALPNLYGAWAKVDLVAARPLARVADAEALVQQAHWLQLGLASVLVAIIGAIAIRGRLTPAVRVAKPIPAPHPAAAEPAAA